MDNNISALGDRLKELETEVSIASRRRIAEARKAEDALKSIRKEDIEVLYPIVPQLRALVNLSAEDLISVDGNISELQKVIETLTDYLDKRLTYYEEHI